MDENSERMRRNVIQRLESLQQAGVMQLPKGRNVVRERRTASAAVDRETVLAQSYITPQSQEEPMPRASGATAANSAKKSTWQAAGAESLFETADTGTVDSAAASAPSLPVLQQTVAGCTRCGELASTRTQTVFGVGDPNARLCFLGEAPGADEDRLGEPFVGRAGQLLTKIIEACKMTRDDVYILNMLKCRPPGNRNPLPTELGNCRGYLERQFDLIKPEFICCLGAVAAQNLLNTTVSIGKLRGKLHQYRGAKVVCTYHPAFLLRSPSFKKETWDDMKFLMREMGVELG
jgi:DNA polymerase